MICFPVGFFKTKWPGYYWHQPSARLFTMKTTGALRPLTVTRPWRGRLNGRDVDLPARYCLSRSGKRFWVSLESLERHFRETDPNMTEKIEAMQ